MKHLKILFIILASILGFFRVPANATVVEESIKNSLQTLEEISSSSNQQCSESCTSVDTLKIAISEALTKKDFLKKRELEQKLELSYSQCLDDRFGQCYPNLKKSIPLNELKSLFKKIKDNSNFRYPNGGNGMCHYRAENLSYFLAESGFKTKTIRIDHSPTLIAMDRNSDGSFNGRYDDYRGSHTLVQIDVVVSGKTVPYLLDPQYMEEALPKEEYFLRTMGQSCQQLKSGNDEFLDLTQCYYFEQKQNKSAEDLVTMFNTINSEEDQPFLLCGWASGHKAKNIIENSPTTISSEKDSIINCTNGETPQKFKDKKVSSSTYKDLIEDACMSYGKELKQQLERANQQVKMSKESLDNFKDKSSPFYKESLDSYLAVKKSKEQIEFSLGRISEMQNRVQKNLKKLP